MTCDEKWVRYDNSRRESSLLGKDEIPQHHPKPLGFGRKIMVTVWWTSAAIIHYSFLKPGTSITADSYCQELTVALEKLEEKQRSLVIRKGPILLHDNARPHTAIKTQKKLQQLGIEVLAHPAYSPDIAPTDYYLFQNLDNFMARKKFSKREEVQNEVSSFFESCEPDFLRKGIHRLPERWQKVVDANGFYFD